MKDFTNKSINANYRKGAQTYVGILCFYSDEFEYKVKAVNTTIKLGKIPYSEIKSIKPVSTFGIVPNGIIIKLKNGAEYNYIISNRNSVIKFLEIKMK
jgi:hypothetical protein